MPTSAYKQILDEVQDQIQDLDLTGISDANVVLAKYSTIRKNETAGLTCVIIRPFSQPRPVRGGPADSIGVNVLQYPVAIMVLQAGNQDQTANYDRILLWLQQIYMEFFHKTMSAVTAGHVYTCEIDHRDTFNPDAWFDDLDAGGMILRFSCQLTRS